MKVKVIGKQKVDYVSRKTGKHVEGLNLHTYFQDRSTEGFAVKSFYLPKDFPNLDKVKVNLDYEIYFNQYGGVDFLAICE